MSKIDQLTGRVPLYGHSRSHSNIASKRRQNLNLQKVNIGGVKFRVSTKTLKALKKMAKIQKGELLTIKQKKAARRAKKTSSG